MSKAVATIMWLALLTGQHVGEIAGIRREEVDLSPTGPIWTQSGSRRKNKDLTRVPLSPWRGLTNQRRNQGRWRTAPTCFLPPLAMLQ